MMEKKSAQVNTSAVGVDTDDIEVDSSYDIVIIGGGLSGINAAYRIQQSLPDLKYTILESRAVMGGTWSFFKYPGMRSDSEIATFAFAWAPWEGRKVIADAADMVAYLEKTAAKHGIDRHFTYNTTVTHADWRSDLHRWCLTTTDQNSKRKVFRTRFVVTCTGYYDYKTPYQAVIPGIENFKGQVVHPQFWPEDFNCTDKNVVVVGSGATAVTLIPSLAKTARHVTMLQRSPSYHVALPTNDPVDNFFRRLFPESTAYFLIRSKALVITFVVIMLARYLPGVLAKVLKWGVRSELPDNIPMDPHFNPTYPPFEQRICFAPDGDFFAVLRSGKASVETGVVETMSDATIRLQSGTELKDVDVIVTATGLNILLFGGIKPTIDSCLIDTASKYAWRSSCLESVPNLCFIFGYTDNAWTLGSDTSARVFTRLIRRLEHVGGTYFVPEIAPQERKKLKDVPLANLSSGYIQRARNVIPKTATSRAWRPRWYYWKDWWFACFGDIRSGMRYVVVNDKDTDEK